MSDLLITVGYLLVADTPSRCKEYILYGLGVEKLQIHQYEELLSKRKASGEDTESIQDQVTGRKTWLNSNRADFLTKVDIGAQFGKTTRQMAQEADLMNLYHYNFSPFSACVHNTWPHVGRFNVDYCKEPLHAGHLIPQLWTEAQPHAHELYVCTQTFGETLSRVWEHYSSDPFQLQTVDHYYSGVKLNEHENLR